MDKCIGNLKFWWLGLGNGKNKIKVSEYKKGFFLWKI